MQAAADQTVWQQQETAQSLIPASYCPGSVYDCKLKQFRSHSAIPALEGNYIWAGGE